jgi:PKD repeat protein
MRNRISLLLVILFMFCTVPCAPALANSDEFAVTAPSEAAFGLSSAFDGTNYLVGVVGDYGGQEGIGARMISRSGEPVGERISVGRTGGLPSVVFDGTNYLMIWEDNVPGNTIYGQFIDTSGHTVDIPFPIAQPQGKQEDFFGRIAFAGDNYLLVWADYGQPDKTLIYGQVISKSGAFVGGEIQISTSAGRHPFVSSDGTNFLVVWYDMGTNELGQILSANGEKTGSNFIIDSHTVPVDNSTFLIFDKTRYVLSFRDQPAEGTGATYARFIGTDGTVSSIRPKLYEGEAFLGICALMGFDGTNYLAVLLNAGPPAASMARTFDAYLAPVDDWKPLFQATDSKVPIGPGLCFDGTRYLAVATRAILDPNPLQGQDLISYGEVSGMFIGPNPAGAASLTVSISPPEAVSAGAKWIVDNGARQNSDTTVTLSPGTHSVMFMDAAGWTTPAVQSVTVESGKNVVLTGSYVSLNGSVAATISPQQAIDGGAKWKLDEGGWLPSGTTVSNLAGLHTVVFGDIIGWITPAVQTLNIPGGQTRQVTGTYVQQNAAVSDQTSPGSTSAKKAKATKPPSANFKGKPLSGVIGMSVKFSDKSKGSITSWLWDFGDGQTSIERSPIHLYSAAGAYTVKLTVTDTAAATNTMTKTNYVAVYEPASADFSVSATIGPAPFTVSFTDLSTGGITKWQWDFGDKKKSSERNPSHTYTKPGTYTVKLTVSGPGGKNTKTVAGCVVAYDAPYAVFVASPTSGFVPVTVKFTNKSTGTVTSWLWDFGDQQTSTDRKPSPHTYSTGGTYTVKLTAEGPGGTSIQTATIDAQTMVGQWAVSGTIKTKDNVPGHAPNSETESGILIFNSDFSVSGTGFSGMLANRTLNGTWKRDGSGFFIDFKNALLQAVNAAVNEAGYSGPSRVSAYSFKGTRSGNTIAVKAHMEATVNVTNPRVTVIYTMDINFSGTLVP